ncbi:MAG: TIGR03862 family flavoprotein [Sphingomonadales bacterium]|nr:TIGR03862 family flavoprotein [Sphingomonadales bacterium]
MPALVIGGGPAGLMAAEELARAGHRVVVVEAKPTLARKFLMAGKSGLNLTRDQAGFVDHYSAGWIAEIVRGFGPDQVKDFARGLGIELFTGSTGRVFPTGMKASPMLRAWIARLGGMGVELRTRWRWTGYEGAALAFDTPQGPARITAQTTVLALGGASWPRLGSDAAWVPWLAAQGVEIAPFRPANMGLIIDWSPHMAPYLGQPVKGATLVAGTEISRGEFVLSARGIEGGGVYAIAAAVRDGAPLAVDLMPDLGPEEIAHRLARLPARESLSNRLRKALRLDPLKLALLNEWGRPLPADPLALARRIKALPVRHAGPRPLAEAISSAGGVTRAALTDALELTALPGTFAAGEMLDWEAPTGGYLLTACLATGRHAGRAAARHLGPG